jgi:hypothetical protein
MILLTPNAPAGLTERYDVCGAELQIETDVPTLARDVAWKLGAFHVNRPTPASFSLRLCYGNVATFRPVPTGMSEVSRGSLGPGVDVVVYAGLHKRRIDVPRCIYVDFDLEQGAGEILIEPGYESWVYDFGVLPALAALLRRNGRHPLHAAFLAATRQGRDSEGVLVIGESGAGKTTSALALAHAGFTMQTDELAVLACEGSEQSKRLTLRGIPRAFRIRPRTFDLLPWLRGLPRWPTPCHYEFRVEPMDLPGWQSSQPDGLRPGLVLFLDPPNASSHEFQPIDPATALMRIAKENVRSLDPDERGRANGSFHALAALVRQTPTARLSAGPRLDRLHGELLTYWNHIDGNKTN